MGQHELQAILSSLIADWEHETVEFKEARNDYDTHKIGLYFSALSNEANLRDAGQGWLVFGIENKSRHVTGTDYRLQPGNLQNLKIQISQNTGPSITFRNIHELITEDGRVVLMEIPAAPRGIPISWKGHYYARSGESLIPLELDKLDKIRQQTLNQDWSAQIVPQADLVVLDPAALAKAREFFAQKHANRFSNDEVAKWPDATFLDRVRLTQNGQITRAALLLLGRPESSHFLSPNPAQISWKLQGMERAYEHFSLPFLLNTTQIYQRIRNIQIRLLPQDQLLPIEVSKYDQKIFLEAMHNCIAHQDYSRNGRIVVTELPDKIIFENEGNFFEGQPDDYIEGTKTPRRYRNPFLVQAMTELNMIDTMGYGIHKIYKGQAHRYLPMPDYDLIESDAVKMTIYGGVVDPSYTRILMQKTDFPLIDVLALDRVQKKLPIPDEAVARLKRAKLIEGRKPYFYVSAVIAAATASKAEYIRTRTQDDEFYIKLVTDYLHKFSSVNRTEINKLLLDKLSDALTEIQKTNKINNLITKMRKQEVIVNQGSDRAPQWVLAGQKG